MKLRFLIALAGFAAYLSYGQEPTAALSLEFVDPTVTDFPGGLGVPETFEFSAGGRVYGSFRVGGFEIRGEAGQISLEYQITPVDCLGQALVEPLRGRVQRRYPRQEGASLPLIRFEFQVPEFPWPGEAKMRVTVTDKFSTRIARTEIPFYIRNDSGEPPTGFEISDFHFYSSEFNSEFLQEPTFRPGDEVWGRFLLSGYEVTGRNQYEIEYGIMVRNAAGGLVLNVPRAVAESKESFYRKAYVPAFSSVRLERNIKPGVYSFVIAAKDGLGKREIKREFPFRIQ
ncbi:MAG: hypothetical protein H7Y20_19540 [Bryobacteraceae bacterium]|nr:hypothetical protein [Bryobacteraceae bacterium]